jgi:Salmonella virulence plasmid 65kDa B protein
VTDIERPLNRQHGWHRAWRKPLRCMTAATLLATVTGASAQQMSLPGNFAVNSSGAATYDIAIAVPPGTAGMVPSLKLSYTSLGVGNGLLGVGWALSGLPSIGRCARTVAQDGSVGAITFTATDMFCLDGQRLIAFNGGAYGVDGTAYRTEIESFSRVIQHGTPPAWFEVHTKAGQVMEFGNTMDSLILAQGKSVARNWALDKVTDTKGNYLTVTYVNDAVDGQAYPSEIDYTGNAAAGELPRALLNFAKRALP